jgi:hypothetical protein
MQVMRRKDWLKIVLITALDKEVESLHTMMSVLSNLKEILQIIIKL